jgi:hypothetical protein
LGVIEFDRTAARALNQIPFHLDLRVLARVRLSPAWLPKIDTPNFGVVAWADAGLRDRIAGMALQLARRRPDVIVIRGTRP